MNIQINYIKHVKYILPLISKSLTKIDEFTECLTKRFKGEQVSFVDMAEEVKLSFKYSLNTFVGEFETSVTSNVVNEGTKSRKYLYFTTQHKYREQETYLDRIRYSKFYDGTIISEIRLTFIRDIPFIMYLKSLKFGKHENSISELMKLIFNIFANTYVKEYEVFHQLKNQSLEFVNDSKIKLIESSFTNFTIFIEELKKELVLNCTRLWITISTIYLSMEETMFKPMKFFDIEVHTKDMKECKILLKTNVNNIKDFEKLLKRSIVETYNRVTALAILSKFL